jgi:hypothetical protein
VDKSQKTFFKQNTHKILFNVNVLYWFNMKYRFECLRNVLDQINVPVGFSVFKNLVEKSCI